LARPFRWANEPPKQSPCGPIQMSRDASQPRAVTIRRPSDADWAGILAVLKTANFDAIGSPEMKEFPLSDCFVAECDGLIIGVGGYRILDREQAKTTLLAVDPEWRGLGIGDRLQQARLDVMKAAGVKAIYTNTDDDAVIAWLERRYGFQRSGDVIPKLHPFGRADRDHWITMVMRL
jgi:N-acetylglutamate synthase-like GNAT family acetyltransferase